jgi:glycosyltransferase involved in cell wall biosynthesis
MYGHWSHTGFGVVTEALGSRFVAAGVDVRIMAMNHRGEPVKGALAGRVWPTSVLEQYVKDPCGAAITGALWRTLDKSDEWKPDVVLVVADMSGLLGYMSGGVPPWRTVPVYHYCPIEGDNLVPMWRQVWELVQPVAMSRYGQRVIAEHIDRPVPMVYHGVDTETFRPASLADPLRVDEKRISTKDAAKLHLGLDPARNVILRSDRLVERKFYDRFLTAMAEVVKRSPNTDILIHCAPQDGQMDLVQELLRLPEEVRDNFKSTNAHDTFQGFSTAELVVLLNAADLYVSTTGGEGFGLNLAEALACEVPVVVSDWAAEGEVVGDGGIRIPVLHDSYGEPVRYHSTYGMDWAVPDPKAFVGPVLELLNRPARRRALGAAGRTHVTHNFNWDIAAAQFLALFEEPNEHRLAS